jgi:hypothetical protein
MSTSRQLLQRKIQQWLGEDRITRNGLTDSAIWVKSSVHHKSHTEHTWHRGIFSSSKKHSPVRSVNRIEFKKHTLYKCENDIFEIVDLKFVPPNVHEADLDQITIKVINYDDSEHTLKVPRHDMTEQDWNAMSMDDLKDYEDTTQYLDALELLEFSRNQVAEEFRADALRDCKVNERKLNQELSRLTANIVAGKVDKMDFLQISVSIPDDFHVIITSEDPSDPSSQKKYRLYLQSIIETEIPKDPKTNEYIFDKIDPSTRNFIPGLPLHRVHCKVIGIDSANKRVQFLLPKNGDRTFYVTDNGNTYFWRRFVINKLKLDVPVSLTYRSQTQELEIRKTFNGAPLVIKVGDTVETRVPFVGDIPQYDQTAKKDESLLKLKTIKCKVIEINPHNVTFKDKDRSLFTIDMNGHMYFWKNIAKLNKMLGWLGLGKKSLKGGFSKQTGSFVTRKTTKQRRRQTLGTN